jgi:hypothetical protein
MKKKIFQFVTYVLLAVCLCTVLSGCGKKVTVSTTQFLGTWETEVDVNHGNAAWLFYELGSSTLEKFTYKMGEPDFGIPVNMKTESVTFQSDGSCSLYLGETCIARGTFTVDENDDEYVDVEFSYVANGYDAVRFCLYFRVDDNGANYLASSNRETFYRRY